MTHRERVVAALNYEETDRVPMDFGATRDSSMVREGYIRLKQYLSLSHGKELRLANRMMQTVEVDEEVQEYFDVDLRGVSVALPQRRGDRELGKNKYKDEWGIVRTKPPGSYYYDQIEPPLAGPLTSKDILGYSWPDPDEMGRVKGLKPRVERLREETDYAIVLGVPSPFIHTSQYLRGFEDWFVDCANNPRLLGMLSDAILEVNLAICGHALEEVGDMVDIVFLADDLGMQNGSIVSPETYRRLFKSRHKRYFEFIHSRTPAKLAFHTCGSVWDLLDDLLEIGVDILHPIQVSAAKMDTQKLKSRYGDRLSFWGGIDTQRILPRGSTDDVTREVRRRIRDLSPGGGYILSAVHNIQPDVPCQNIVAMYECAKRSSSVH